VAFAFRHGHRRSLGRADRIARGVGDAHPDRAADRGTRGRRSAVYDDKRQEARQPLLHRKRRGQSRRRPRANRGPLPQEQKRRLGALRPGYANGKTPYGIWSIDKVVVDRKWSLHQDPDDDFAFLVFDEPKDAPKLQSATGSNALDIGQPLGQTVVAIGYPESKNTPVICRNTAPAFDWNQLEFVCRGYPEGTSGGPLLTGFDVSAGTGTIIGVIGGFESGGLTPSVSYAASFTADMSTLCKCAVTIAISDP
jgi:hypothetical protein